MSALSARASRLSTYNLALTRALRARRARPPEIAALQPRAACVSTWLGEFTTYRHPTGLRGSFLRFSRPRSTFLKHTDNKPGDAKRKQPSSRRPRSSSKAHRRKILSSALPDVAAHFHVGNRPPLWGSSGPDNVWQRRPSPVNTLPDVSLPNLLTLLLLRRGKRHFWSASVR